MDKDPFGKEECVDIANNLRHTRDSGYKLESRCKKSDIDIVNSSLEHCRSKSVRIPKMTLDNICHYTLGGNTIDEYCCSKNSKDKSLLIAAIVVIVMGVLIAILMVTYFIHTRKGTNTKQSFGT